MISLSTDSSENLPIRLREPIPVRELAEALNIRPARLVADLFALGITATLNGTIDAAAAARVCAEYGRGFEVKKD